MTINIPAKVRFALYLVLGVGSIIEAYVLTKGYIGIPEDVAWKAFTVLVGGLAASKVDLTEDK